MQVNFDNQMFGLGLAEAGEDLVDFDGNPVDGGSSN